jgi:probable addiction module antidote protein
MPYRISLRCPRELPSRNDAAQGDPLMTAECQAAGLAGAALQCMDSTAAAAYLTRLIEAGDAAGLAAALGNLARMRGMAQVARDAGLTREALYRALRADSHPRFDTILRVCAVLGVKLSAHPLETAR